MRNERYIGGIPFLVTDDFVKIGNFAYPITHSFIVGERWVHDSCEHAILECYNTMPPMRPLNTSYSAFSSNYGVVSETFTFACNNMTDSHCLFVGQLSHEYGGSWAIEYVAPVRFLMYSWCESSMVRSSQPPLPSSLEP
ncbi:MAG: hypothetical protein LBD23_09630, partial [Oscillospiraceae bacterium]|nr:hypothetical protein [Oscillospiraceae bacterium]